MTYQDENMEEWVEQDTEDGLYEEPVKKPPVKKRRKKKRRNRRMRRAGLGLLGILVLLIALCLIFCRVQKLDIRGNHRVSDEEIRTLINWDSYNGNTLLLWLMNRRVDVSGTELLAGIKVSIAGPQTVRVEVNEQTLVGCIEIGGQYFYVNENGMVVLTGTDKLDQVPVLVGLEVEKAEQGDYLKTASQETLDDMLHIADSLEDYEVYVESVEQMDGSQYFAQMGKIKILLGRDIYMDEKISELRDLLPELETLSGTLHLEDYDSTKDSIIFTKDS